MRLLRAMKPQLQMLMEPLQLKTMMLLQMPMEHHLQLKNMVPLLKQVVIMMKQVTTTMMTTAVVMVVGRKLLTLMVPHQHLNMVLHLLLTLVMVHHLLRNMVLLHKLLIMNMMCLRMPMKQHKLQPQPMKLQGVAVDDLAVLEELQLDPRAPVLAVQEP